MQMKTSENKSGTTWKLRGEGNEAEEEATRLRRRWRRMWRRRKWRRRRWRTRKRKRKI